MTTTGRIASDSAASTLFQSVMYWPRNCCTPSVIVCVLSLEVRISGNHRSFQIGTMVNTATVAIAGRSSGSDHLEEDARLRHAVAARGVAQVAAGSAG